VLGATSQALTVAPSLSIAPDPHIVVGLQAAGTKFDNAQWSVAGGASLAARVPIQRWAAIALSGAGAATKSSYDFSYLTVTALPALELSAGRIRGFVGMHGTYGSSNMTQVSEAPGGLLGMSPVEHRSTLSITRTARAVVYGASAQLAGDDNRSTVFGIREERGTTDTVPTVDRAASVSISDGRVTVGGTIGRRSEPTTSATFGNGSLSIAMTPIVGIEVNAGTYLTNRLVGTPAGRFVNLGLSLRMGRSSIGHIATPTGVPAVAAGMTRLTLRDDDARSVDVAGDFTNWKYVAATRAPNGVWFVDLRIPPGRYRYAFRVDQTTWRVPNGVVVSDDDFGGKSAWLTVRDPSNHTVR
jgi:hypothetical protein